MLVVKIELWPHGDEGRAEEIGRTYIANVGGSLDRGDYNVAVCRRGTTATPREVYDNAYVVTQDDAPAVAAMIAKKPKATRSGKVTNYPRRSYNVWRLVVRALKACFPEEA